MTISGRIGKGELRRASGAIEGVRIATSTGGFALKALARGGQIGPRSASGAVVIFGTLTLCTGDVTGFAGIGDLVEIMATLAFGTGGEGVADRAVFRASGAHFVRIQDFGLDFGVHRGSGLVLSIKE